MGLGIDMWLGKLIDGIWNYKEIEIGPNPIYTNGPISWLPPRKTLAEKHKINAKKYRRI